MSSSIFGFVGKDYVVLVADASVTTSILLIKSDLDKIYEADDKFAFCCVGEPGDDTAFSDYIVRNIQLNKFRNGYSATSHANANWMRYVLAKGLRSQPYQCNCVIGAIDVPSLKQEMQTSTEQVQSSGSSGSNQIALTGFKPHLYYLDYLGTLCEVPFCAHGYCGYLLYGLWDSAWKPGMDLEAGKELLRKSIAQLQRRFIIQQPHFIAKVITKDGIQLLDL
ncbi:MAG: putative Family T1, proteasome beta subunit, threonine peptidase [Streblomastix strix]|uniref:Proteasome subunit beta n=1 Tax=Streblomastix strix TaxID=222440 RepID=A0A5J4W8S4_9EUKA|nr:MAG: putative Family T1, proteasome beta subunit, threonine peptidase [Streblomastix strix]